jgi:hypothetical protein
MKLATIVLALGIALVSACSMTLPVRGQVQNSDEEFAGTATGYINGGGNLTIVSNKGATCKGNFVYETNRRGSGVFTCDDGRTGPFEFASTGSSGTGFGDLGGQRFTFTFGDQ